MINIQLCCKLYIVKCYQFNFYPTYTKLKSLISHREMSLNDVTPDFLLKVIVIGDSGVGKSNLLTRWHSNTFQPISTPTIGVEFFTKTLKISTSSPIGNETKNRDYFVKVQVWDTA